MKIILLEGEDVYLKLKKLNEIKDEFLNLKKGVNYFKYTNIDPDDLIYELDMPSFLPGEKLIILEDETYLKQSESNFKKLIKFLDNEESKNINAVLVIISEQKLRDTNKLKKIALTDGKIYNVSKADKKTITNEIFEYLKQNDSFMEYKDIIYFIETVGDDLYKIINELDKLVRYTKSKSEKNIKREYIDKVVNKTIDSKMFEVTKVLEVKMNKKAVEIINENFKDKTEILGLISYLYSYYLDILLTKEALENGIQPRRVLNLPPNRSFMENIYIKVARNLELNKIKYILKELSRIDELTKTDTQDTLILLKALIMNI